jgi:hypothetical protein
MVRVGTKRIGEEYRTSRICNSSIKGIVSWDGFFTIPTYLG